MKPNRIGMLIGSALFLSIGVIGMPGCSSVTTGNDGGGTEGGTDSGGGTEGGSEGGTCAMDATCANYCAVVSSSCSGVTGEVTDMATCMAVCGNLPLGMKGDTSGNTVGCRVYHACVAGSSAMNKTTHCPHADVWQLDADMGGQLVNTCGTTCDAFCAVAGKVCPGVFTGANDCATQCGMFMDGTPGATSGNTRACREYHLGVAAQSAANAMMHCPHIGVMSSACM
jgi:hypothetical protein